MDLHPAPIPGTPARDEFLIVAAPFDGNGEAIPEFPVSSLEVREGEIQHGDIEAVRLIARPPGGV